MSTGLTHTILEWDFKGFLNKKNKASYYKKLFLQNLYG